MRQLPKPMAPFNVVCNACISGISDLTLRRAFDAASDLMQRDAEQYDVYASKGTLHSLQPMKIRNEDIALGNLTKQQLKDLYGTYMVKREAGRKYYDEILMLSDDGVCPLCSCGYVSTLDHYLPKGLFPSISVLPTNLVPACRDCNTSKLAGFGTELEMSIHPYFDDQRFFTDRWIFAKIRFEHCVRAEYFVSPPAHWDFVSKRRVKAHFKDLNLQKKYAVAAADELASTADMLSTYLVTEEERVRYLNARATSFRINNVNAWQAALLSALASDKWYVTEGFRYK